MILPVFFWGTLLAFLTWVKNFPRHQTHLRYQDSISWNTWTPPSPKLANSSIISTRDLFPRSSPKGRPKERRVPQPGPAVLSCACYPFFHFKNTEELIWAFRWWKEAPPPTSPQLIPFSLWSFWHLRWAQALPILWLQMPDSIYFRSCHSQKRLFSLCTKNTSFFLFKW